MFFKTDIAQENWDSKYRYDNESEIATWERVALNLASVEKEPQKWYDVFLKTIVKFKNGNPVGLKCTPGGRITANIGTKFNGATLLNCFIGGPVTNATVSYERKTTDGSVSYPVNIKTSESPDDLFNIFLTIMEQAKTLASEGGYGLNFDWIRPRGYLIKGTGIRHPGVVAYLKIWDAVAECIVKGDNDGYVDKIKNYLKTDDDAKIAELIDIIKKMPRKGAMLCALSCHHPDIEEYVRAKQSSGMLTKFNMSVLLDDKFLNAVENDDFYEQGFNGKITKKIKARDLYDLIMESTYNRGEPGVLFYSNMQKNNPVSYLGDVTATNPCIIGSSIIATADGRNGVSIKQLAEEGIDLPVYSRNKAGLVQIKMGRNPRKTGEKKEVWKLTLDDESVFIATPDHKMLLRNGTEVQLKDLKRGDSLIPFQSYTNNGYRQIAESSIRQRRNGLYLSKRQYRLIYRFYNPDAVITKDDRIHHTNFDKTMDNIQFLKKCTEEEHFRIHDISGKNNPMFRLKDRQKYHENMSKAVSGLKNGRAKQVSTDEILNELITFTKILGRRPITHEISDYLLKLSKSINAPTTLRKFRLKELNCKGMTEVLDLLEQKAFYNHKVKHVEFYGYEDVYNITVDDNHNYCVLTSWDDDKFMKSSGICVKNCGEVAGLSTLTTVCLLGSVNLTQYIEIDNNKETYFDWQQYETDVRIFARMLDNVCNLSNAPLPSYSWSIKNVRQYGMGLNGLGSAMMMLGIPYNSKEGVKFARKAAQIKENLTWQTSALLAEEKGVFPAYNKEQFESTEYFKSDRITDETRELLRRHGARNGKTTTNPPAGTTAIICDNTSNGIEPPYRLEYERKAICKEWPQGLNTENIKELFKYHKKNDFEYWDGEYQGKKYYYEPHNRGLCECVIIRDYGYQWLLDNFPTKNHKKYAISANDLNIDDHLAIQEVIQYYNNQSCSKTINLPNKYPFEDFKNLYLKAWKIGLVGLTTYREGSMESVLSSIDDKRDIIKKDLKLPDVFLNGPTTIIKKEGIKYYIHFSYFPDDTDMKYPVCLWIYTNSEEKGMSIVCNKASRELAKLAVKCGIDNKHIEETLEKCKIDYPHNRLGRFISLCLRHNVPREDILMALQGIEGDNISTLLTAVRKFIGQTIKEGTKLPGKKCPNCNVEGEMIFESGCFRCLACNYAGCG